jgi:hypothetical protein
VDPLQPSAPPSALPEVNVDPPQPAKAAARAVGTTHRTVPIAQN